MASTTRTSSYAPDTPSPDSGKCGGRSQPISVLFQFYFSWLLALHHSYFFLFHLFKTLSHNICYSHPISVVIRFYLTGFLFLWKLFCSFFVFIAFRENFLCCYVVCISLCNNFNTVFYWYFRFIIFFKSCVEIVGLGSTNGDKNTGNDVAGAAAAGFSPEPNSNFIAAVATEIVAVDFDSAFKQHPAELLPQILSIEANHRPVDYLSIGQHVSCLYALTHYICFSCFKY